MGEIRACKAYKKTASGVHRCKKFDTSGRRKHPVCAPVAKNMRSNWALRGGASCTVRGKKTRYKKIKFKRVRFPKGLL